jgi:hypothetical protein
MLHCIIGLLDQIWLKYCWCCCASAVMKLQFRRLNLHMFFTPYTYKKRRVAVSLVTTKKANRRELGEPQT